MLGAALEAFTQHGYGDTAIDEIARASDTSKGGLYFHFPSKQALFLALLDEASAALLGRVEVAMAEESDPLLRGDAALREVLHVFGGHRLLARLLLVEALGAGKNSTRSSTISTSRLQRSSRSASTQPWPRVRFLHWIRRWRRTPGTGRSTMSSCAGC